MSYVRKNIFGFATIAATVTLSAAIFATGCGDSGDSTAVNPLNPDKIANAITVNYDADTEAALKSSNVESLRWLITDTESGKQLASKDTVQKINYTGTATKANAALAEENTTSDDTTADKTPTSATKNDKCYVVLGVPSTVFQNMTDVTVTAIYYDKDGHVVGFGSDINDVTWNTDKSGKKFSGTITDGNFFSAQNVKSELVARPQFINKGEVTKLAYEVTDGTNTANIIGLVDVQLGYDDDDKDYYIKPTNDGIVGAYKGVNFTKESGVYVSAKFDKNATNAYTNVYVTDRTPSDLSIDTVYDDSGNHYDKTVLIPEKVAAAGTTPTVDYALGQSKVLGINSSGHSLLRGVRQLPLSIKVSGWSDGKGEIPSSSVTIPYDEVAFAVQDKTQKTIQDVIVDKDGIIRFNQSKIDSVTDFVVVGTYGKATGKMEGGQAIPVVVNVGLSTKAKAKDATTFESSFEVEKTKDGSEIFKMYAQFAQAPTALGSFTSYLFEIPEAIGFTYPKAVLLQDGAEYPAAGAAADITVADNQKKNEYKLDVKASFDSSIAGPVTVAMGKDAAATKEAFTPYTNLVFSELSVKSK